VIGFAGLALLAPFAVLARQLAQWRRGSKLHLGWTEASLGDVGDGLVHRFDVIADVPHDRETAFRKALTDTVVRLAESMRRTDDIYHFAVRYVELGETTTLAVGPQLQELGERFALALTQGTLEGRTAVWLTLPRQRAAAEVLDPFAYDPEASGEPERLLTRPEVRWGMATSHLSAGPSVVHRILLYLPTSDRWAAEQLLERLKRWAQRTD
jgi:hypothetical protein